jgi:hypothetical protein
VTNTELCVICRTSRNKGSNISVTHEVDNGKEHRILFSIQVCLGLDNSVGKRLGGGWRPGFDSSYE